MTDHVARLAAALAGTIRIERELGGGGMSQVFLGTELQLGRAVVVKVLPPDTSQALSAERFRREILIAARLQHPNIVPVLATGVADGRTWYSMPFVPGASLGDRLRRSGALPVPIARSVLRDVLRALGHAHRQGIVHRDIKPGNVLLADDVAVVTDFGIAKAITAAARPSPTGETPVHVTGGTLTQGGSSPGTPLYMAPEQFTGDGSADQRADLYAWAVLAHELLVGERPFADLPAAEQLAARLTRVPPPVHERRPEVPRALSEAITRCLAVDPAARHPTADAVLAAIEREPPAPPPRRTRARRLAIGGGAVLLALVAGTGWAAMGPYRDAAATVVRLATRPDATLRANRLVVVPFEATGDTTLATLGEMVADYATQGLAALASVEVVDFRTTSMGALVVEQIPVGLRSRDKRRALAEETGAGLMVTGRVYRDGDSLRATATLVEVESGRVRQSLPAVTVPGTAPLLLVSGMQSRMVAALAQRTDSTAAALALAAAPPSLEAYELARSGWRRFLLQGDVDSLVVADLRRAAALDTTWAFPHLALANAVWYGSGDRRVVDAELRTLERLANGLTAGERAVLDNMRALRRGDFPAAYAAAERLALAHPASAEAVLLAAQAALHAGRPRQALRVLARTDPDRGVNLASPIYYRIRAWALLAAGRHGELAATLRAAERSFPWLQWEWGQLRAIDGAWRGDAAALTPVVGRVARGAAPLDRGLLAIQAAATAGQAGRAGLTRAMALVADSVLGAQAAPLVQDERAWARFLAGRPAEAIAIVDSALRSPAAGRAPAWRAQLLAIRGAMAARTGDSVRMRAIERDLRARAATAYTEGRAEFELAGLAAARGDAPAAVALLDAASRKGFAAWYAGGIVSEVRLDPAFTSIAGHPAFRLWLAPVEPPGR